VGIDELDRLLIAAGEAPPDQRILLRDPLAAFGAQAITRLTDPVWIADPKYSAFALRVIAKAADFGAREEAIRALKQARTVVPSDVQRADIVALLASLGATPVRSPGRTKSEPDRALAVAMDLDELVVDGCYKRRALHLAGLGGSWRTGISYPAHGTHCLLFSDPSKATEYGYRDAPTEYGYRYFGRWDGQGDMTLTGGNQVILDRSPELYLFTQASCGYVFRGRFACSGVEWEMTTRDGREARAVVFKLERAVLP
jgi:hypothetical protein